MINQVSNSIPGVELVKDQEQAEKLKNSGSRIQNGNEQNLADDIKSTLMQALGSGEVETGQKLSQAKLRSVLNGEEALIDQNKSEEELQNAQDILNDFMIDARDRILKFDKDEDTGKRIIKIIDRETDEVVRQIPPQEFLEMVSNLNKVASELLKDLPKYI